MELEVERINAIRNYFSTKPVLNAYLFGSFARNEADYQSDIDILVDLDYSQKIGLQFIQMKLDLEKILGNKVDLVSSRGLSPHIRPIIDIEKKLIYAR
ncbi:MAG: nucleotidyltransferase domain-containing protein [Bacteroidia bacterium]|nr:nucleotidyltransferase domain-containing protein [Bacteroidia bacterium]